MTTPDPNKKANNSGKNLGIAGFAFGLASIVFGFALWLSEAPPLGPAFALVAGVTGLTVSIVAFAKSRRSNRKNPLAIAGATVSSTVILSILALTAVSVIATAGGQVHGSCKGLEQGIHTLADGSVLECGAGILGIYNN